MPEEVGKEPEESSETPKEKTGEETPEKESPGAAEKTGALFGPGGTMMMFAAGILDLAGLFLLGFGLDDFGITDIIGIFLIGGWMYSRSGSITLPGRAQKKARGWLRKLFRGKWKKYLTPFIGEIIPYFGGIAFCWTLAVYYELTD